MDNGFRKLIVYQLAYNSAMQIFELTKDFPKSEIYSLTDQIRRSSRSICANIGEAYRKRSYPKHFSSTLTIADAECSETLIWLDFAKDCKYLNQEKYELLTQKYVEIGKMLGSMTNNPEKFIPKNIKSQNAV